MVTISCKKNVILQSNMYIITQNRHAIVIDPRINMEDGDNEGAVIDAIILTHEHYDHICGVNKWKEKYHCPVWCGKNAREGIINPRINMSHYGTGLFEMNSLWTKEALQYGEIRDYTCETDEELLDGQIIKWQNSIIEVIETPGHSMGSICLLVDSKILFSGDTLLPDTPTGVKSRGGNVDDFFGVAVPKLRRLNDNLKVFPGHGGSFYLKDYAFWEAVS